MKSVRGKKGLSGLRKMLKEIDCRGLACPIPALKTKKALEAIASGQILTIVDNNAAKENVTRLADFMGCEVNLEKKGADFHLTITKPKRDEDEKL